MEKAKVDLQSIKQQLELDERYPEAVKYYTQVKEELEKYNEQMRDLYGRQLMRMIDVTRIKTNFTSMKRSLKIAHDKIKKYESESSVNENQQK